MTSAQLTTTLKAHAESVGITISDIADVTGISRSNVSRILNGKQDGKLSSIFKIADCIGVTLEIKP